MEVLIRRISLARRKICTFRPNFTASSYSIASQLSSFPRDIFKIHPKVNSALKSNLPVVALESTIITHGMPYPQNLKTAIQVEDIIKQNGALPATIAILDGKIHVGLEKEELERLASLGSQNVRKTSRRDLAMVIANKMHGATTVSGTMSIAHMAGIKVFVTGGIGGVHRGVEETMDISADLTELGRTPVAVVCAGVKSILDIGRTLEYLETQGVTVTTYGKSSDFPAFYAPSSGYKSPFHSPTIDECAALIHANAKLKLDSGIVIATPIPEKDAGDSKVIQSSIDTALQELRNKKISGKDCTPFLLSRIAELSGNVSLEANIALIKNNARIGALIAGRYSEMARGGNSTGPGASLKAERERLASETEISSVNSGNSRPMVIGGAAIDLTATISEPYDYSSNHRSSFPGKVVQTMGGVGRNIAEACHRSGGSPLFVSIIGNDPAGVSLLHDCSTLGIDTSLIKVEEDGGRTGICNAIMEPNGELIKAVADMSIFERIDENQISSAIETQKPSVICFDGNLSVPAIQSISASALANSIPLFFEPTSVPKSKKIFQNDEIMLNGTIQYASPNLEEVVVMGNCAAEVIRRYNNPTPARQNDKKFLSDLDMSHISQHMKFPSPLLKIIPSSIYLLQLIPNLFIKCGPDGVLHARYTYQQTLHPQSQSTTPNIVSGASSLSYKISVSSHEFYFEWHPPSNDVPVKNVTGAGDSFVGTILTGLSLLKNQGQLNFEKPGIVEGRGQVNHLGRMTGEETEQRPGNEIWRKVVGISKRSAELTLGEERSVSLRIGKLNI